MNTDLKQASRKLLFIFAAVNLLEFVLYYATSFIVADVPIVYEILVYLYKYLTQIVNSLFPMIVATVMLVIYAEASLSKSLIKSIPYTLTLLLYLFPYWSFYFAYQMIEISGVMLLSLLYTAGYLIIAYIKSLLLFLLMIFFIKIFASRENSDYTIKAAIKERDALDFSKPITKSIFSAAFALFIYNVLLELLTATIPYFKDSIGIYLTEEIISLVLSYIVILAILLITHFAAFLVKNKLTKT